MIRPTHINQWFSQPAFDDADCDAIINLAKTATMRPAMVLDEKRSSVLDMLARNCKIAWLLPSDRTAWLYQRVNQLFADLNDRTFKFNLDGVIETLQYVEYGPGCFYWTHTDSGASAVATRKLSMTIQLSHPSAYWGGGVRIYSSAKARHASKARGTASIFPSHLYHRADPVWMGKRKTLIAWMRGTKPLS